MHGVWRMKGFEFELNGICAFGLVAGASLKTGGELMINDYDLTAYFFRNLYTPMAVPTPWAKIHVPGV